MSGEVGAQIVGIVDRTYGEAGKALERAIEEAVTEFHDLSGYGESEWIERLDTI